MGELKQLMGRAGMDALMEFLICGGETDRIPEEDEEKDAYQERINAAFEGLFDGLGHLFRLAARDSDELCSLAAEFSAVHQEVYTEMGFLAGFRFCWELQEAWRNLGDGGMQSVVKRIVPEPGGTVMAELRDGSLLEIRRREAGRSRG